MPKWLTDAVFYEIYPQSFYDTNADGIGDFNGIIEKLDYIKGLGCNALWINPCFDSPFKDAGYDVQDYRKVAPRYGTNQDLYRLFEEAHARGIHVLLDLVPGHTSEEHPWFLESQRSTDNEFSNRYVWTDFCFEPMKGYAYIGGESERSGTYLLNFFKCQPALNYGFSTAPADALYLPIDSDANAPSVESQEEDSDSLLHTVRILLSLRHDYTDLQADAEFSVIYAEHGQTPFVYSRGSLLLAVNPSGKKVSAPVNTDKKDIIYSIGNGEITPSQITLDPQSFIIAK